MTESLLIYGKGVCAVLFFLCCILAIVLPFALDHGIRDKLGLTEKDARIVAVLWLVAMALIILLPGRDNWNLWIEMARRP